MPEYSELLRGHYGQPDLCRRICAALEEAGLGTEALSLADLATFDEFHIGGRNATMRIGRLAGLRGERLLDIGCAIGGPARTLASEFGCAVVGLDIVREYVLAARMLTRRVGMSDVAMFCEGDSSRLPFGNALFDVVWSQHTIVNVPEKRLVLEEAARVLKPGGRLSLYEVCSGLVHPPVYPLPWAGDSSLCYLTTADELADLVESTGFTIVERRDVSDEALQWIREARLARKRQAHSRRPPSLALLMGADAALKSQNMARNLEERRTEIVLIVAEVAD